MFKKSKGIICKIPLHIRLFLNFKREQQVIHYIKANICASEANIAI